MTTDPRTGAADLSAALRELHRALIRAEAGDDPAYSNPYTLLFAVIGNPRFSWLERLSQLIVGLDEARADKDVAIDEVLAKAIDSASAMIGEEEGADPQFRLRHLMAVQQQPDVAIATGRLRRVLVALKRERS